MAEIEVSIVVPAYNEEESIRHLRDRIVQHMNPLGIPFEILFVDDGSNDETWKRLRELSGEDIRVGSLRLSRNFGQTAAMAAGIDAARGRVIVTMDADLQNDPADIPLLLERLSEGYDLVVGYRLRRQDKFLSRKLPSMVANRLIGYVTGLPIRDNGCSLKAYRAAVIKQVPLYSDMHRFIPAMAIPFGARIAQVAVSHHARQFGSSKYGLWRIYKVLLDLITIQTIILFARRPLACFSGVAAIAAVLSVATGLVAAERIAVTEDASTVLPTICFLFGWLAVFVFSAGLIAALAHVKATEGIWLFRHAGVREGRSRATHSQ